MRMVWIVLAVSLGACGGRVAHPVSLENDFDDRLSCTHLSGEFENNLKRLEELTGESKEKFANNLGLLIASPLFLDFSDTQKREAEALLARNERLQALMTERDCPAAEKAATDEASAEEPTVEEPEVPEQMATEAEQ